MQVSRKEPGLIVSAAAHASLLAATLDEHRESLARLGLETEPFGDNAALIRSVPPGLGARDVTEEVLDRIFSTFCLGK